MKNFKIAHQLVALIAALFVAFAGYAYFQIRGAAQSTYNERIDMLRSQVETAVSVMQSYYDREKAGEFSHDEAEKRAFATITKMKFQPNGYFVGLDYDVVLRIHPVQTLVGQNQQQQQDKAGTFFSRDMVNIARKGGGVTEYFWPKPGDTSGAVAKKAAYGMAFEPWKITLSTGVYMDDLDAKVNAMIINAVLIGAIVFALGMAAAFYVIRGIATPLTNIHQALGAVADENVGIKIPHTEMSNEVGMMAKATQALQEKIRERHAMATREENQKQELDRERQQNLDMQQKDAASQARVVSTIGEALEALAQGDLTVRCGDLGPRYETLRHNFNDALGHLEAAMAKVNAKGLDIGGSKEEIRRASNELSQRTERQAANLEETSAALDELAVTVRQTAEGAHEASKRVTSVSSEASRSDKIVAEAIEAMGGIEHSSEEIGKIIGVIDEIAFQTNLLALNAGVEAARAGESGKGFAVVAQEVRELAQRSAAAAKEIKDQISRSSGQVQNGVRLVGEAGEALKRISDQVKAASEIVGKIAHSASEQDTTLRSISSSLNQLDAATQHNAAMAEETTASAEALAADTDELLNLISSFRLSNGHETGGLNRMAQKMRRAS
jgi:methyl-accepting chemotaxis protein